MKKKLLISVLLFFVVNILKAEDQRITQITFDNLFPATNYEKVQKLASNLYFSLMNNVDDKELIEILIDVYAYTIVLVENEKKSTKLDRNDLMYLIKMIDSSKQLLNNKYNERKNVENINFIFDKILNNLNNI